MFCLITREHMHAYCHGAPSSTAIFFITLDCTATGNAKWLVPDSSEESWFFAVELVRKAVDLRERRYVLSPILARRVWGAALKRSVFIACIWCLLVHTAWDLAVHALMFLARSCSVCENYTSVLVREKNGGRGGKRGSLTGAFLGTTSPVQSAFDVPLVPGAGWLAVCSACTAEAGVGFSREGRNVLFSTINVTCFAGAQLLVRVCSLPRPPTPSCII